MSKGNRVTFIRSTFSDLLIYFLSLLPIPSKITRRLVQRDSALVDAIPGSLRFYQVSHYGRGSTHQNFDCYEKVSFE